MARETSRIRIGTGVLFSLALALSMPVVAQTGPAAPSGPSWSDLSAGERLALQPLQGQWRDIDSLRKQKWRDVAVRYSGLPSVQQARLHERMVEWASMTPAQRNTARISFEDLRTVPAAERQTRWAAYQNLPADQRQALTIQATSRPGAASSPSSVEARRAPSIQSVQAKSNIVATPQVTRPQSVAPGTVQAGIGASTRPISKPPTAPRHQQAGLPKIAAMPEFVQNDTLLPQRGPQGVNVDHALRPDAP